MLTAHTANTGEPGHRFPSARAAVHAGVRFLRGRTCRGWWLPLKVLLAGAAIWWSSLLQPIPVIGAMPDRLVQVQLVSGRRLTVSRIELLTGSREVLLQSSSPGLTISRRLPVAAVHSVTVAGRTVVFPNSAGEIEGTGPTADLAAPQLASLQLVAADESSLAPAPREMRQPSSPSPGMVPAAAAVAVPPSPHRLHGRGFEFRPALSAPVMVSRPRPVGFSGSAPLLPQGSCGSPGRLIGVRAGPLAAYADLIAAYFPFGVPASEAGAVLPLLRAARAQQMLAPPLWQIPPSFGPGEAAVPPGPVYERPLPPTAAPPALPPVGPPGLLPQSSLPAASVFSPATEVSSPVFQLPPGAASLKVVARPETFYGQGDIDSLAVEVCLVSPDGRPLPFQGTLNMQLSGLEVRAVAGFGPVLQAEPVREQLLATRAVAVQAAAGSPGAAARLPLSRLPERNTSLAPVGNLQVELVVPGRGVFVAVVRDVPLAGHSQLENWRLLTSGRRFSSAQPVHSPFLQAGALYRRLRKTSSLGPAGRVFAIQP